MNESHEHYASEIHGAGEHHRHYDTESEIRGLCEDLRRAAERIAALEAEHDAARRQEREIRGRTGRDRDLPRGPADPAPGPGGYDPGPEAGMPEHRYAALGEQPW